MRSDFTSVDRVCSSNRSRKGHNLDSSDAASVTTGPSSRMRSSVSLTLGPATLTSHQDRHHRGRDPPPNSLIEK